MQKKLSPSEPTWVRGFGAFALSYYMRAVAVPLNSVTIVV